jgi:transcriptional regulator with XRE-family HTH domain
MEIDKILQKLGQRLSELRLQKDDTQENFAMRLGVSISTLKRMEKGDPAVAIGKWLRAFWVLDRQDEVDKLLIPQESRLASRFVATQKTRKRASRQ